MPHMSNPTDIANTDAAMAAECHRMAWACMESGQHEDAAYYQRRADEWAATAIFNRLLVLYDDADAAEEAYDRL